MRIIKGNTSTITIDDDIVIKTTHSNDYRIFERELYWYDKFKNWDRIPKLLSFEKNILKLRYCGELLSSKNIPRTYKQECEEILSGLKKYNCSHNDIRPANVLIKEGKMYLIDFQWATQIGEKIPDEWPMTIGSRFRMGDHIFNDRYSLYETLRVIHPINAILKPIIKKRPVSFARYGDGEWSALLGIKGANCDKHPYYPDMGRKLAQIIKSEPKYLLGMQDRAMRLMGDKIKSFINGLNINWIKADLFHWASINGDLFRLFKALEDKEIMIVGGKYLRKIKVIKWKYFVDIPERNCWLKHDEILKEIIRQLDKHKPRNCIVLFCASMMANVLIDELYHHYEGKHSFIDAGSVFDPYVGKKTRKYHKTLKI